MYAYSRKCFVCVEKHEKGLMLRADKAQQIYYFALERDMIILNTVMLRNMIRIFHLIARFYV